jgi:hypothetical protein
LRDDGQLSQHVGAVASVVEHGEHAPQLTFRPAQPPAYVGVASFAEMHVALLLPHQTIP